MEATSPEEMKRALAVIVLAAGLGTRMKSKTPKVLHQVCGKPMIAWVSDALQVVAAARQLVVLGDGAEQVHQILPQRTEVVIQERQLGTGDAVRTCREQLKGFDGDILVMYGDTPLVTGESLEELREAHAAGAPACTLLTVDVADPSHYGRVCRDADGRVVKIVEARDASEEEEKICEINGGVYIFRAPLLWSALSDIGSENAQGELYLTDVIEILSAQGEAVLAHKVADPDVVLGVNSRLELAQASQIMRGRILDHHMREGVTIIDPASTYVDAAVQIGRDTILEPMTVLRGATAIGEDCVIGPSSTIVDSSIDDGVKLVSSHVSGAEIAAGCNVGPFAFLRPGARLEAGAKAGTFVEIKNSIVGERSKVPHLSYIGDAEIGRDTNVGAGNITANYDGFRKHKTKIGSRVHTGADSVFVAPVEVGDDAMTAAGSVITSEVPAGDLGIGRARQRNIKDYAKNKFADKQAPERQE